MNSSFPTLVDLESLTLNVSASRISTPPTLNPLSTQNGRQMGTSPQKKNQRLLGCQDFLLTGKKENMIWAIYEINP